MQGRSRLLSEKEFDRLDRVLADFAAKVTVSTSAAGALRFLMLTHCRPNEIVTLKRGNTCTLNNRAAPARPSRCETGVPTVALSPAAKQLLTAAAPARQPLEVSRPRARSPPADPQRVVPFRSQGGRP